MRRTGGRTCRSPQARTREGAAQPAECQRATDLYLKTQWLLERGGGIVFATGTPIANTIAESWTMARYLMRDKLEELGLHHFDPPGPSCSADTVVTLGRP